MEEIFFDIEFRSIFFAQVPKWFEPGRLSSLSSVIIYSRTWLQRGCGTKSYGLLISVFKKKIKWGYFRELVQGVYKQISFAKQPVNVLRTCPLVSISPCMDTIASTLHPVKLTHSVTAPPPLRARTGKGKGGCGKGAKSNMPIYSGIFTEVGVIYYIFLF